MDLYRAKEAEQTTRRVDAAAKIEREDDDVEMTENLDVKLDVPTNRATNENESADTETMADHVDAMNFELTRPGSTTGEAMSIPPSSRVPQNGSATINNINFASLVTSSKPSRGQHPIGANHQAKKMNKDVEDTDILLPGLKSYANAGEDINIPHPGVTTSKVTPPPTTTVVTAPPTAQEPTAAATTNNTSKIQASQMSASSGRPMFSRPGSTPEPTRPIPLVPTTGKDDMDGKQAMEEESISIEDDDSTNFDDLFFGSVEDVDVDAATDDHEGILHRGNETGGAREHNKKHGETSERIGLETYAHGDHNHADGALIFDPAIFAAANNSTILQPSTANIFANSADHVIGMDFTSLIDDGHGGGGGNR